MKSFRQFISEALETIASSQAKQMGLRGDGHGDWYDNQGKLVAKTIGSKLQVFKGRDNKGAEDKSIKKDTKKQPQPALTSQQPQVQQQPEVQEQGKGIVVVLGKFNPPGKAHEQLLKFGFNQAKNNGSEYRIYPSRIEDKETNPLNPTLKIKYMRTMYPEYADYIIDNSDTTTLFDVLTSLSNDGFTDVKVVVGSDRVGEFQSLAHRGEGETYQFNTIEVIPAGVKDPDSDVGGAGSSAQLRAAVAEGNFESFSANLPTRMKRVDKEELFNSVANAMQLGESYDLWRIAPELDMDGLRMNYKINNLYPIGSIIENLNTGLQGRVLRRGTNYLICVTNEGVMFKSWLQNIREAVYEVGTDKYREKLQSMTPGQPVVSYTGVKIKETMPKKKLNMNSKCSTK